MLNTRTSCPILTCDTWKSCRILCRFQIWRNIKFLIVKIFIFLTYANLCKLGDYWVNITFQHAEPPGDQICQVSFQYHKLNRFYGKSAHQLLRSSEMTQMWPPTILTILEFLVSPILEIYCLLAIQTLLGSIWTPNHNYGWWPQERMLGKN